MEVICMDESAFFALIEKVIEKLDKNKKPIEDKWISGEEAMRKLRIKSKTTLLKLRNQGSIRYTQPETKIILYDSESIDAYLDDFTYETF